MSEPGGSGDESHPRPADRFPSTDFDPWAETYDHDVISENAFPFDGYEQVLDTVVRLAAAEAGMSVLDLGTGTANLALRFAANGCELWCTDFSQSMLDKARTKLPGAHFLRHDLREAWPQELERRFDRIVSAYVFHHFELGEKVRLCQTLIHRRLKRSGKFVIADISFDSAATMQAFARGVGDHWELEPYWLADEAIAALTKAGLNVQYTKVSACAGVYCIDPKESPLKRD